MKYRYIAEAEGQAFEIELEDNRVTVNGQTYTVDMENIDGFSLFSLLMDNTSYEVCLDEHKGKYRVLLRGEQYTVQVEDEWQRRARLRKRRAFAPSGEITVRAPMPGLVVDVPVQTGQEVIEGQPLVILESMKMENELLAPRAGVVKAIHVTPGEAVDLDQPLVVVR